MTRAMRKPAEAEPARLGALAKLPVFFDLAGKPAVVAGGTAAAAWKAELLAAAGADVAVFADVLHAEMQALLARGAAAGSLRHAGTAVDVAAFTGAAIFVADAADEAEAAAFVALARQAGVPVNVIDRPAFCDFQFGSIVNRSPVVVGISTDGAAPILGQAIRRRIEAMLPPALADWAGLAKRIRGRVSTALPSAASRRRFWERFSDWAFTRPAAEADADMLAAEIAGAAAGPEGRVTLVGAGPGDAGYLTLKALRALQSADVILFDNLVGDDVLELARREARRMLVGKRGHRDSCRQEDINDLMVKLARQGKHVVRLKSGDPAIFGRAGEELARLEAEGIPAAVVPGITAASAMAASLRLSLTHRDSAQSVRFVTGHSRHGCLPEDLDWQGLADPRTTTVVYMGGRTAGEFARRLIEAGLPAETPAVLASGIARPDELLHAGEVRGLGALARQASAGSGPVLIGIGWVFQEVRQQAGGIGSGEPHAGAPFLHRRQAEASAEPAGPIHLESRSG